MQRERERELEGRVGERELSGVPSFSFKDTDSIALGPSPLWLHLTLITSLMTLSPKQLHSEILGLGLQHMN